MKPPENHAPQAALLTTSDSQVKSKQHAFSFRVAKNKNEQGAKLGAVPAIILGYLANRVREKGTMFPDGKRWFRVTTDHIKKQYPYLGKSTVADNLKKLEKFHLIEVANLNRERGRPKFDRTCWYHVPEKFTDMAEQELRYFDPNLAAELGLPAAVVQYNFGKRLKALREGLEIDCVDLRPRDLSERLPFDHSTCKRAIQILREKELIFPVPEHPGHFSDKPWNESGSNPDGCGSNPNKAGSNPDETGSNPDNYIVSKINKCSLEECSKGKPEAFLEKSTERINGSSYPEKEEERFAPGQQNLAPFATSPPAAAQVSDAPHDEPLATFSENVHFPGLCTTISSYRDMGSPLNLGYDALATWKEEDQKTFVLRLLHIACQFLRAQNELDVLSWDRCTTADELYPSIAPRIWFFFQTECQPESPRHSVQEFALIAAAQLIFAGFLRDRRNNGVHRNPPTGLPNLAASQRDFHFEVLRITMPLRQRLREEEMAARRKEFASADEDKEFLTHLSPAEKARIFKNGVNCRNQVGWTHFTRRLLTDQIKVTKGGLKEIERLFELNRELTPRELLEILDRAMDVRMDLSPPSSEYEGGVRWHARQGAGDVWKFARYLRGIVRDLEYECSITFLGDAARSAGKRRRRSSRSVAPRGRSPAISPGTSTRIRSDSAPSSQMAKATSSFVSEESPTKGGRFHSIKVLRLMPWLEQVEAEDCTNGASESSNFGTEARQPAQTPQAYTLYNPKIS